MAQQPPTPSVVLHGDASNVEGMSRRASKGKALPTGTVAGERRVLLCIDAFWIESTEDNRLLTIHVADTVQSARGGGGFGGLILGRRLESEHLKAGNDRRRIVPVACLARWRALFFGIPGKGEGRGRISSFQETNRVEAFGQIELQGRVDSAWLGRRPGHATQLVELLRLTCPMAAILFLAFLTAIVLDPDCVIYLTTRIHVGYLTVSLTAAILMVVNRCG
jgi:hypothetical protein